MDTRTRGRHFSLLINNDTIAKVEIDRYDHDIEPIIESKQLDNVYLKGLSKYSQIRLAIALELANRDLQDEEKKLKEFPN